MKIILPGLVAITVVFLCTMLPVQAAPRSDFRLIIPAIQVNAPVTTAYFRGDTWDFSPLTYQAGILQGSALPGQGGHVIIGAHSELARRKPGPFYRLDALGIGDKITITLAGVSYTYTVTDRWTVSSDDVHHLYETSPGEMLTLLTCTGYDGKRYTTRLIVRARR